MDEKINSHKDLLVWRKSMELTKAIYKLSENLPTKENFGLQNQIRRAAISVPSNIAEGKNRKTIKDFLHFLRISYGSIAELETQLILMGDLYGISSNEIDNLVIEVSKMLRSLMEKLETRN